MPSYNDIRDRNQFPNQIPEQVPVSNPDGHTASPVIDYYQTDEQLFGQQPDGTLSLYDPVNPDRILMDSVEQEVVELSSPPVYYYKLIPGKQQVDRLYGESKMRYYETPVQIFGNYEDTSPTQLLTRYGLDEPQEVELWFNYNYLLNQIGDQLHIGDIIRTIDSKIWEISSSLVVHQDLWRAIHNNVKCHRALTEGISLPDIGNISVSPNKTEVIPQESMGAPDSAGDQFNIIEPTNGMFEY